MWGVGNCLSAALEHRWRHRHDEATSATGNVSQPRPACESHLHLLRLPRTGSSARPMTRESNLWPSAEERPRWSELLAGHQTEPRGGGGTVSGPDDLFLFVCRFSLHLITRRSAVDHIHDMHYGGVVVAEDWILIPCSFTLFPKKPRLLWLHQAECDQVTLSVTNCCT